MATIYQYDITDPDPDWPTTNNRLMQYGLDTDGDGTPDVRNVFYTYYKTGHVSNITIKDEYVGAGAAAEFNKYRDLALYYARNGTLWLAVWGNYTINQYGDPQNYTVTAAREFRYDNRRQRYMSRGYVISGDTPAQWTPMATAQWTDYNGVMPYLDFDLGSDQNGDATYADQTRYLAGRGVAARQDATGADEFLHGDLIRSTVMTTDNTGTVAATVSYTAFGELTTSAGVGGDLPPGFPRQAYAGGWGYETGLLTLNGAPGSDPIILQHLGARWYQPDTGRFIMRDPIGIRRGLNVYAYGVNNPVVFLDPSGLTSSSSWPPSPGRPNPPKPFNEWPFTNPPWWVHDKTPLDLASSVHFVIGVAVGSRSPSAGRCVAFFGLGVAFEIWETQTELGKYESPENSVTDTIVNLVGYIVGVIAGL